MKAKGIRRRVTRLRTTARSLGIEGKAVDDSTDWEGLWSNPKLQAPNPNHSQLPNPKAKSQGQIPRPNPKAQIPRARARDARMAGAFGWDFGAWKFFGSWELGVVGIWDLELGI